MRSFMVFKRFLTQSTREQVYLDILNSNFDNALQVVRKIPKKELDYGLLHTFLSKGCQWGHIQSVDYIWYRFVMRLPILIVSPNLLCDIGNLALHEEKGFIPDQLYIHYMKFHGKKKGEHDPYRYELLRIRVESFAKGTMNKTTFKEKWKMYLEDMDSQLPPTAEIKVRDFPFLTKAMGDCTKHEIMELLFTKSGLSVQNRHSLPLLLNMFLLQPKHHMEFKIACFQKFSEVYSLGLDDSLAILFRQCRNDGYHLSRLMDFAREKGITRLSPVASKAFLEGISGTNYHFKTRDFVDLLARH
ncbi:hypothetical protein ZYGR_0AG04660 [Zygosaccharomyces rouxii]|uniref:Protein PET122, mitochondrial n=1 Tax=Zygosaccharomyces rouxii TaxID=4956 RepID=A0A1Q3A9V1_ZYGRO|nr:hypothetical protein ZYGR_0AG04660 [Zygosaccharomyces rouxii]